MELELVPKDETSRSAVEQGVQEEKPVYLGPERRKNIRRITVDRREMVRFEDRTDRRHGRERRVELQLWNGRDT